MRCESLGEIVFTVRSHYLNESKIIDFKLSDGIENRVYNNDNKKKSWKKYIYILFWVLGNGSGTSSGTCESDYQMAEELKS